MYGRGFAASTGKGFTADGFLESCRSLTCLEFLNMKSLLSVQDMETVNSRWIKIGLYIAKYNASVDYFLPIGHL